MKTSLITWGGRLGIWLLLSVVASIIVFFNSTTPTIFAGHDARVGPSLDRHVVLGLGPYLPDLRTRSKAPIGVRIDLGKTEANDLQELATRYGAIASRPGLATREVKDVLTAQAIDSGLRGAVIGAIPVLLWVALGKRRRHELRQLGRTRGIAVLAVTAVGAVLVVQPWQGEGDQVVTPRWISAQAAVPDIPLPAAVQKWQVQGGLLTTSTRRLVHSAVTTYDNGEKFYQKLADEAPAFVDQIHQPNHDQLVAVLVSDRHDNIGMDSVVAAFAEVANAEAIIDAGDDTSTGSAWETFSVDSLAGAFEGYDERIFVAGNHDHGKVITNRFRKLGWTHLKGASVDMAGVRVWGVDDPRSSGLGNWRDQKGPLTFAQVKAKVAKEVCALDDAGKRVGTVVVHDANMGATALDKGCTDLVVGGHVHVQMGPTAVIGSKESVGYSYTNGTTGGAAYAIALGSKPKRDAGFTFITYEADKPVGIQNITIQTTGNVLVSEYTPLTYDPADVILGPTQPTPTPPP